MEWSWDEMCHFICLSCKIIIYTTQFDYQNNHDKRDPERDVSSE